MRSNGVFIVYCNLLSGNNRAIGQYTDQVEEQHAYIKETVDTVFPSNIRVLEVNMAQDRLFYLDSSLSDAADISVSQRTLRRQ